MNLYLKILYFYIQLCFSKLNSKEIEFTLLDIFLKKGDTFIDVGSNIGRYSLKASKLVKNKGNVFSFEPCKNIFFILCKLIELGNYKNIITFNLLLSDKAGKVHFKPIKTSSNKLLFVDTYTKSKIINSKNKNNYSAKLDSFDFNNIKLIKIDTEGNEYNILIGSKKTLKKSKPIIIIENNKLISKIRKLLTSFNYKEIKIQNSRNLIFVNIKKYNKINYLIKKKLSKN